MQLDWMLIYAESLIATEGKTVLARDLANTAFKNGHASRTTDWQVGGPMIDDMRPYFETIENNQIRASLTWFDSPTNRQKGAAASGATYLIAAARLRLLLTIGQTVDVPEEIS
jgi:hypothetical protein